MCASQVIPPGPRVGLVLGGGGVRGAVFHAAALAALEIDLGWDARTSDVVVGTSAGAIMGLLLRLGISGTDLAAMVSEVPQHAEHELIAKGKVKPLELPDQGWRNFLPPLNLRSSFGSLAGQVRNPGAALLSLYGAGDVDFLSLLDFIPAHTNNTWPEQDLRICAVRNDFRRIVWDSSSSIGLDMAVSSSCSMPGYASGIDFDGWTYFDGGLHSPTNADVLCSTGIDLAIILSPMTPERQSWSTRRSLMSRFAERRLASEVSRLRERGVETVVLRSPSSVARASSGIDTTMRQPEVGELAESFFSVGSRLSRLREALRPIAVPENGLS
jgi:NTE family protein